MTCRDVDAQLAMYMAGTLSDDAARQLEQHAATCATCEAALDSATRRTAVVFTPALPPTLRDATLAAVATRSRTRRARVMALRGTAMLAAAAMLVVWLVPRGGPEVPSSVVTSSADTMAQAPLDAADLAAARATSEFDALDAATREIRAALEASPSDAQLQAFLASVTAQRAELMRRVRDAKT